MTGLSRVDFPAPLGPTICQCSPGLTVQLRCSMIGRSLYDTTPSRRMMRGAPASRAWRAAGHPVPVSSCQPVFAVRQLSNQRLLQQRLLFSGFAQGTVGQHAGKLDKRRDFVEAVEYQYQREPFEVQSLQQPCKLLTGSDVQAIKGSSRINRSGCVISA